MFLGFFFDSGNKLKTPSEITPPFKGDKKWASGRECLGGALGAGFHMSYMMVTILYSAISNDFTGRLSPCAHFLIIIEPFSKLRPLWNMQSSI